MAVPASLVAIALAGSAAGTSAAAPPGLMRLLDLPRGLDGPWRVRGRIVGDPRGQDRNRSRFELDVAAVHSAGGWRSLPGVVTVWVDEPVTATAPLAGDVVEAFLRLRPDRPRSNPGQWRRHRALARGIWLRAGLKSYRQLRHRGGGTGPGRWAARWRRSLRRSVDSLFPRHRAVVKALILGERGGLEPDLTAALARAGLAHLLAISGLHVGLVIALVYGLARALGASPTTAAALSLGAVGMVLITVVPRAPVRRAGIMAAAYLAGRLAGRRTAAWTGLSLALTALAVVRPGVVRDVGFQLSAAATLGIQLLGTPLTDLLKRTRVPGASTWAVTLSAQIGVAPVLASVSHRLALAAVVLNPLAIPITGVVVASSLTALAVGAVGLPGAPIAAGLAEAGIDAITVLARTGDGWRWSNMPLSIARLSHPPEGAGRTPRMVALDVGQGDAILVDAGNDPVLVDAGGFPGIRYDTGSAIVAPALRALGITGLRAVAVSHLHADHAGGVPGVLAELPTREVWIGSASPESPPYRRIADATVLDDVALIGLAAGGTRRIGDCRWRCLHPDGPWLRPEGTEIDNDASLVIEVRCGDRSLLLPGDAELPAERLWIRRLDPARHHAVLKVPHHGSLTSSGEELLDGVFPRHAVISAGWRNRFGLPRAEILDRYRSRGVAVYRTDRDGAVIVELGRRVRVRGMRWSRGDGDPADRLRPR